MGIFFTLLLKTFPLYFNIILGYFGSRYLHIAKESIANLLIYLLGPIVVFSATVNVQIDMATLFLPIFFYIFGSIIAFGLYYVYKNTWKDSTVNILAFSGGTGNTGYFGIPLAILFLPPSLADIYIFTVLASLLYESTTGFYITAKGNFTLKDSLKKISRLPLIYAFILGLIVNIMNFELPNFILTYTEQFKSAYGILGMMLIGMGLIGIEFNKNSDFDMKFFKIVFGMKFIFWPLSILSIIFVDKTFLLFLNDDLYKVMFLFSIVPLAGNTVTLAILLGIKPQKASLAILFSTIFSLFFIPFAMVLYGGFS